MPASSVIARQARHLRRADRQPGRGQRQENKAQRSPAPGAGRAHPKQPVERDRDAFINATIQDLVNQSFPTH